MEHGVRETLSCEDGDLTPVQVYFKSWTGTTIGFPPAEGGGGLGQWPVAGYHSTPAETLHRDYRWRNRTQLQSRRCHVSHTAVPDERRTCVRGRARQRRTS